MQQYEMKNIKKYTWLIVALFVISLIPIMVISVYNRPSADDYMYCADTQAAYISGANWQEIVEVAVERDLQDYNTVGGLYTSVFLQALQPAVFGAELAFFTFPVFGGIFVFAIFCVLNEIFNIIGEKKNKKFYLAFFALIFSYEIIQGIPLARDGFFWWTGCINYIFMFSLGIINCSFVLYFLRAGDQRIGKKILICALSCMLSIVISGGHILQAAINIGMLTVAVFFHVRKKLYWIIPSWICAIYSLLILNLNSPGTALRKGVLGNWSFVGAAIKSFLAVILDFFAWLDVPLVCLVLVLTPVLVHIVTSPNVKESLFKHPLLHLAGSFVLLWGLLGVPFYSLGSSGPGRLVNIIWICFIMIVVWNYAIWIGWLIRVKGCSTPIKWCSFLDEHIIHSFLAIGGAMVIMGSIGGTTVKDGPYNHYGTSLEAAYEIALGIPQRYAEITDEYLENATYANVDYNGLMTDLHEKDAYCYILFGFDMKGVAALDKW